MQGRDGHQLAYVGVAFVALSAAEALNVIWRIGSRVERQLSHLGSALPAPTQLAFEARLGVTLFVLAALALAVVIHRRPRPVLFLVLLGLLQLSIAGAYGLALWLPYRPPEAVIR